MVTKNLTACQERGTTGLESDQGRLNWPCPIDPPQILVQIGSPANVVAEY